jgi:hypothetical protein
LFLTDLPNIGILAVPQVSSSLFPIDLPHVKIIIVAQSILFTHVSFNSTILELKDTHQNSPQTTISPPLENANYQEFIDMNINCLGLPPCIHLRLGILKLHITPL